MARKVKKQAGNRFGVRCPQCECDNTLSVAARVWVKLEPNGTVPEDSDHEWDAASGAKCTCGWAGKVKQLKGW